MNKGSVRLPKVTVRSTCFNHADFLEQSLDSVARQDFTDIQWIIVDDASQDDSVDKIRGWLSRHQATLERKGFSIEFRAHSSNRGFVATLNEIVAMTRGAYICGLATDDIMLPNRVSSGLETLEQSSGCVASYSDAYVIDTQGNRAAATYWKGPQPSGKIYEALLENCFICAPTVLIRTQALREAGNYDASIVLEDYDMWLRVAAKHEFAFCPHPLVEYRLHEHNFTKSVTRFNERLYWIYRKQIAHRAGERRFLHHYAMMAVRGEIPKHLAADFQSLCLRRPPLIREFFRQLAKHPGKVCRGLKTKVA